MMADTLQSDTEQIVQYYQCERCYKEIEQLRAAGVPTSPRAYARLNVGRTPYGVQVWCVRHDVNVFHIDFGAGRRMRATGSCVEPKAPALDDITLPETLLLDGQMRNPRELTDDDLLRAINEMEMMAQISTDFAMNLRALARYRKTLR